ncbi:MAG: hypothetical protein U0M21_08755 [Emergencia sp.]|nr:hypothetical protein [Emergencia sp.]
MLNKLIKGVVIVLLLLSVMLNIFLYSNLSKAYEKVNLTLSEKVSVLCGEVELIEEEILSYGNSSDTEYLNLIGEKLYENCYDKSKEISSYKNLGDTYACFDLADFEGFILEFVRIDENLTEEELQEKRASLLTLCALFQELRIPPYYDLDKDPDGHIEKLNAITDFCFTYTQREYSSRRNKNCRA